MVQVAAQQIVAEFFLETLREALGPSLKEVWLFGSRARGDAREDSDWDMLVVAEGNRSMTRRTVQEAEWHCMEKWSALVSSIVYPPGIWTKARVSPLGLNIRTEGIRVA